jgi:hypothetical protein
VTGKVCRDRECLRSTAERLPVAFDMRLGA